MIRLILGHGLVNRPERWLDPTSKETRRRDGWYTAYHREIRRYDILNENVVTLVGTKAGGSIGEWEEVQAAAPRDELLGGPPK